MEDLAEPGFHSGNPETWPSHQRAQRLAKLVDDAESAVTFDMTEEAELDMASIAELLTKYMSQQANQGVSFMLNGPCQVTCKRKDGSYLKRSHIGGEEFAFGSAYVGKKGKMIFTFLPKAVSDYERIELMEHEALNLLGGFKGALDGAMTVGSLAGYTEAKKRAALQAEREALAVRADQYQDFGAWS